jgi:hypothetical protein
MRRLVKKRIGLLCLVLAMLVLPVAAQTAIVSIGTVEVAPDSSATLPIIISGATNLGSGTIDISYDPAVVHVSGVTDGTGNALQVQSWHAEEGIVRIVAWDATSPHSGTVIFANVTFNAVGETTQESPLNITVRDLENYFNYTRILCSISNGTFTISQSEGPTPTPASGGGGGSYYYTPPAPTPPATIAPPPVTSEASPPSGTPAATATLTLTPSPFPAQPTPSALSSVLWRWVPIVIVIVPIVIIIAGFFALLIILRKIHRD